MKHNLFLLALLCLTMALPGCLKNPEGPYADGREDGKFRMTLSIGNMEEISTRSAASTEERSIKNLMVLIFDKTTGKYSDGEIVAPENLQGADGDQLRTVTINLTPAEGDKVVMLANYDPSITAIPFTQNVSTTADINTHLSCTPLINGEVVQPMSGEFTYSVSGMTTCQLTRALCKIQLTISPDLSVGNLALAGFEMRHWQAYNILEVPDCAIYSTSPLCTVKPGLLPSSFHTHPTLYSNSQSCYVAEYPVATKAILTTIVDTQFHKDRSCLIVTTTNDKYYRIDLFDHQTRKFIDMRRNTHINITITKVNAVGYDTINDALAAPGGNIEYDIKVQGENDRIVLSNGSYALTLSNSQIYFYTDKTVFDLEVCTARYILPDELTELSEGVKNSVALVSPNSAVTVLTSKINKTDTPIKIRVQRASATTSLSTKIKIRIGALEHEVLVEILPPARLGSTYRVNFSAPQPTTYRWIQRAKEVTLDEQSGLLYTGDLSHYWVCYDASGAEIEATEDDFEAVPRYLMVEKYVELETCSQYDSKFVIAKLLINVRTVPPLYIGWFGGDPIGETDDTGGPRFSKRLLADSEDGPDDFEWGPEGPSDDIEMDQEQGKAITKLLGEKGPSYFAAYYCYKKNDTNLNGVIDVDEPIVWYLPAQNQLMAMWTSLNSFSSSFDATYYWSSTVSDSQYSMFVSFTSISGMTHTYQKIYRNRVRCVRDF